MAKRYFEFVEGTSNKFWEIWKDRNEDAGDEKPAKGGGKSDHAARWKA